MMRHSLSALFLAAGLVACGEPPAMERPLRTVMVGTAIPAAGDQVAGVYAGDVRPRYAHELAFRTAGKLLERGLDVGATVRIGDVLARLDARDAAAAREAARAGVNAAEAQRALARAELQRAERLHGTGFVASSAVDAARTALEAAEASVRQARSQLAVSELDNEYMVLKSGVAGVVSAVHAEVGQVVSAGQPVYTVVQRDPREVSINVPEASIALHAPGQPAVVVTANGEVKLPGVVREIAPVADSVTRTYAMRVALAEGAGGAADGSVLPLGASARVVFLAAARSGTRVPLTAVVGIDGAATVWRLDANDTVQPVPVVLGALDEQSAHVVSGLEAGARVVVAGAHRLVAGEKVRPVDVAAPVALDVKR